MAGKNKEYAEQYAEYAMEQMRRYGIPASVTLAQGILESSNGESQLARNENNHFGIKATHSWIDAGGKYGLYTDDKPDEKFCSYNSVGDSYEHHSEFLKGNNRYTSCFKLSPDDYQGWAKGLDQAGYATANQYAPALIDIIERNGLDKYDRMVMEEMRTQGRKFGTEENPRTQTESSHVSRSLPDGNYSFPVKRDEFLFVTSAFGKRNNPTKLSEEQIHKGIDIRTDHEPILATEDNGKVITVNDTGQTAGGKSVTVEYDRPDGTKVQVAYCHLDAIHVKVGDTVQASEQIGISGNTGTRTTGAHLHFGVKQMYKDGTVRDMDPAAYLAEIAQKGNISLQLLHNGQDLLAKYKTQNPLSPDTPAPDTKLAPDEWMKKLLSSEDSGICMNGGDPVMQMIMTLLSSLMALAVQIDGKSEKEQMEAVTDAALKKNIDLTSLVPSLKECCLHVSENDKPILSIHDGTNQYTHELTTAEMNRLSIALSDNNLSGEEKQQRIASIVTHIAMSEQASRNYEQGMDNRESRTESLQIK